MSEHLEITIVSTPKIGVKFRRKCMIFTEEDMKVAERSISALRIICRAV